MMLHYYEAANGHSIVELNFQEFNYIFMIGKLNNNWKRKKLRHFLKKPRKRLLLYYAFLCYVKILESFISIKLERINNTKILIDKEIHLQFEYTSILKYHDNAYMKKSAVTYRHNLI